MVFSLGQLFLALVAWTFVVVFASRATTRVLLRRSIGAAEATETFANAVGSACASRTPIALCTFMAPSFVLRREVVTHAISIVLGGGALPAMAGRFDDWEQAARAANVLAYFAMNWRDRGARPHPGGSESEEEVIVIDEVYERLRERDERGFGLDPRDAEPEVRA